MPNAKQKLKLTKTALDALVAGSETAEIWDTTVAGFHVRVFPSGTKVFYVYYRTKRGIARRRSLGSFPTVKVEEAREMARKAIAAAKDGKDPFGDRDAQREIPKLKAFWQVYWNEHAVPQKSERSAEQDQQLWTKHLEPTFGEKFIDQIDSADVRRWHAGMKDTPGAANRALALLSKMASMWMESGYGTKNPCKHTIKYPENQRDPDLGPEDAALLWSAAVEEEADGDAGAARAVLLILLTGARRNEVLNARWADFSLQPGNAQWRVPIEHIKGGKRAKHSITRNLSDSTAEMLAAWKAGDADSSGLLFPSPNGTGEPRYDIKKPWGRIRTKAGRPDLHLHDLRHLFATLAIFNGHQLEEIGETLGHRCAMTTRRYAHILARQRNRVASTVSSQIAEAIRQRATDNDPEGRVGHEALAAPNL